MAALDRSEELSSNVENGSCNSNEGSSNWIESVVKVRKPYVVTKQREKWSEEEHERFLEAIKLYGRAWRQIQEHIGTKTALQIRSHAQKFFSKVVRESDSRRDGAVKAIVIPPPRPKRKPTHPYPRKLPLPSCQSPPSNVSAVEKGAKSPTSVLSAFASEDHISRCSSPNSCTSENQFIGKETDYTTSTQSLRKNVAVTGSMPISSITLFGKIVLVTESHIPSSCGDDDLISVEYETGQENHYLGIKNATLHIGSRRVDTDLSLGVGETSCTGSNAFGSVTDISEKTSEPINSARKQLSSLEIQESCYPTNGFRPYKRCLSEREVTSSLSLVVASEEQRHQRRARVCS